MERLTRTHLLLFAVAALSFAAGAPTTAPQSGPDVLLFTDGEKLIGHLERSVGSSVVFKSDMAGEITVDWSKIKELHTAEPFAVIEKGTKLGRQENTAQIPQGDVSMANQQITVAEQPAPVTLPVSNTSDVVEKTTFDRAVFQRPGFFEDWKGTGTAGISLILATQDSRTYTSAISVTRTVPDETWMNPSNRTTLSFTSSYGELTQPGTPTVKTSIYHADGERDQYFSPRLYAFADAGFDHDYSQGLDLQQTYGGGTGWTAIKRGSEELNLKAEVDFVNQEFFTASSNQKLLGSIFSEGYNRTFKKKIVLHEQIGIAPAWTNTRAYSANGNIDLTIPVIKRIGITLGTQDTFLNDPSPGFKKNSVQFTTGVTYSMQ